MAVDVAQLAASAAARGIVGALIGPMGRSEEEGSAEGLEDAGYVSENVCPLQVGRSERLELENLVASYVSSSRRPKGRRDAAECGAIAGRLDAAIRSLAVLFRSQQAAAADVLAQAAPLSNQSRPLQPMAILPRLLSQPELSFDEAVCNASR